MTALAPDAASARLRSGLLFALVAALAFGMSGTLAKGLMDTGWTAGGAVLFRVGIAAAVLVIPGAIALRGRWHLLWRHRRPVVVYGLFAVAGAQLFYFLAVSTLSVSVALLIEYSAPVVVVVWLWLRHGNRPTALTVVGAIIAAAGMVLLLNVIGGGDIDLAGVGWALLAMGGAAVYFIISGDNSLPLPPLTLAAGGLLVATATLGASAWAGILPFAMGGSEVALVPVTVPSWVAVAFLGVVTAALAYVAGIAATRRLGSRLGSFVALSEVIAAAVIAWLFLAQVPAPIQVVGAVLVLAGVVVVKLGEPASAESVSVEPLPVAPADAADAMSVIVDGE